MNTNEKKNDGGPAFPVESGFARIGMSMRDYFAAQAMAGFLSEPPTEAFESAVIVSTPNWDPKGKLPGERTAVAAYMVADAMLKAREQ